MAVLCWDMRTRNWNMLVWNIYPGRSVLRYLSSIFEILGAGPSAAVSSVVIRKSISTCPQHFRIARLKLQEKILYKQSRIFCSRIAQEMRISGTSFLIQTFHFQKFGKLTFDIFSSLNKLSGFARSLPEPAPSTHAAGKLHVSTCLR